MHFWCTFLHQSTTCSTQICKHNMICIACVNCVFVYGSCCHFDKSLPLFFLNGIKVSKFRKQMVLSSHTPKKQTNFFHILFALASKRSRIKKVLYCVKQHQISISPQNWGAILYLLCSITGLRIIIEEANCFVDRNSDRCPLRHHNSSRISTGIPIRNAAGYVTRLGYVTVFDMFR